MLLEKRSYTGKETHEAIINSIREESGIKVILYPTQMTTRRIKLHQDPISTVSEFVVGRAPKEPTYIVDEPSMLGLEPEKKMDTVIVESPCLYDEIIIKMMLDRLDETARVVFLFDVCELPPTDYDNCFYNLMDINDGKLLYLKEAGILC